MTLGRCDLFAALDDNQRSLLERHSRKRVVEPRRPIYLPSEPAESVFVIERGIVKLCQLTSEGKESILGFAQAGEVFGEFAIVHGKERDEYAAAVERSHLLAIPAAALSGLLREHAGLGLAITRMMGHRRHRIERRLRHLLFLPKRERLIHLLLDLADQFGEQQTNGVRLRVRLSHQELGNWIGSTRETVTLLLGQFRLEGLVRIDRRRVTLRDPRRMADSVGREWALKSPADTTPGPRSVRCGAGDVPERFAPPARLGGPTTR